MNKARTAVDKLLNMYDEYKTLAAEITAAERRVALARLKNGDIKQAKAELDGLRQNQQQLSDAMTFDTPLIWAMYKFEAYKDEAQPIRTMHDFRLHCSKPGYICTKRFLFLNAYLCNKKQNPLTDNQTYPDDMLLDNIFSLLGEIEQDAEFLASWRAHEYYQEDGAARKWQNYKPNNS
jgi:hypothetical protein